MVLQKKKERKKENYSNQTVNENTKHLTARKHDVRC